jgi:hypothetical protein
VKKIIAVLLLLIYLVSTTEAYQLLKIPLLIGHYREHKKQYPEITVAAFLKMHYDHPQKDADYETDQKLPFVKHVVCFAPLFTAQASVCCDLSGQVFRTAPITCVYPDIFYKSQVHNAVWQPPRHC